MQRVADGQRRPDGVRPREARTGYRDQARVIAEQFLQRCAEVRDHALDHDVRVRSPRVPFELIALDKEDDVSNANGVRGLSSGGVDKPRPASQVRQAMAEDASQPRGSLDSR